MLSYSSLLEQIRSYGQNKAAIAFSGGADSTLIVRACVDAGILVFPVLFLTELHPKADQRNAEKIAKELGVELHTMAINELEHPLIRNNSVDRCYHCKYLLFQALKEFALQQGIALLLDGTNADDLNEYRPGLKALKELGVRSPLAEIGIGKQQVRLWLETLDVSVFSRPSSPCMATRLPYHTEITMDLLKRIESAEDFLKQLGFTQVRVRVHQEIARIEVLAEEFVRMLNYRSEIVTALQAIGFRYITLDLEGFRSGSMDLWMDHK